MVTSARSSGIPSRAAPICATFDRGPLPPGMQSPDGRATTWQGPTHSHDGDVIALRGPGSRQDQRAWVPWPPPGELSYHPDREQPRRPRYLLAAQRLQQQTTHEPAARQLSELCLGLFEEAVSEEGMSLGNSPQKNRRGRRWL